MYYFGIDNHDRCYIIHADRLDTFQRGRIEQLSRRERRFAMLEGHLLKRCFAVYQTSWPKRRSGSLTSTGGVS
ncbi:hypothetical protein FGL86_05625 [Pistricoccus aurantiacus]|uniref:Uncharacterized protein n=1 Tax=Pistricoccus aurantiacus TaxID=1883414 RepID=A0A5B8SRP1_9GAMM|nr:hypothetical protein [Pistricoccus aurantiacus]QEA38607.1 hypothetical protein FGL86_05625 [Pistricoccus aurantiacus]